MTAEIDRVLADRNRAQGPTLPIAEQSVTLALRHADRSVVLKNGRSVLEGGAETLRSRDDIERFHLGPRAASPARERPPV